MPHRETWMHADLGDRHLGLDPTEVQAALRRAGFEDVRVEPPRRSLLPRLPRRQPSRESADAKTERAAGSVALPLYLVRGRVPQS